MSRIETKRQATVGHFEYLQNLSCVTLNTLFIITALAIMHGHHGNQLFWIIYLRNCPGLSLCEILHFVLFSWSRYFTYFLSYIDITKLLEFKMAAQWPF